MSNSVKVTVHVFPDERVFRLRAGAVAGGVDLRDGRPRAARRVRAMQPPVRWSAAVFRGGRAAAAHEQDSAVAEHQRRGVVALTLPAGIHGPCGPGAAWTNVVCAFPNGLVW